MERFEWFPIYLKALTEPDSQKRLLAIDNTLGTLVERYELLQHDPNEEREFLLKAIAALRDLRKQSVNASERGHAEPNEITDATMLVDDLRQRTHAKKKGSES